MWEQYAAELFGIELTSEQVKQFDLLARELADWNENRMNLTAITELEEVRVRHFLDSLSIVQVITFDGGDTLIDVGTGAGFPGLPLAIVFPKLQVTLMEATKKKLSFIEHMAAQLGLNNVKTLHARAEDAGQDPQHREKYDVVTARAVARLPALLEYLLPLAKVGGFCVAMKGVTAEAEARSARRALKTLGGDLKPLAVVDLPDVEDPHYLITVEKTRPTPQQYPRKPGIPTRDPIS